MAIQGQGQHLNLKECSLVSRSRINYDQIMPSMSSLCYGLFEFQVTLHLQKVATKCTILWHPICYYFPLLESVFHLGVACKIMRRTQWCGMAVFHKLDYTSCPACPTSKNASTKCSEMCQNFHLQTINHYKARNSIHCSFIGRIDRLSLILSSFDI